MRRGHAEMMSARNQDLRQAEEQHAGQEQRILAEVDRATHKGPGACRVAREQQRRAKGEEAARRDLPLC